MQYSDSVYLSKFAVDADLEYTGDDLIDDGSFLEAPYINRLDGELSPDLDMDLNFD